MRDCSSQCTCPWTITDVDGSILARFSDSLERDEALLTGDFPEDAEPAYENEWEDDGYREKWYYDGPGDEPGWQDSTFPNEY